MKKLFVKILLFIVAFAIITSPLSLLLIKGHQQEPVYTKTYYAALVDKVNLLEKHKNDKKIILVGGSNVAFGFDSKYLENIFPEYKVINFGLYAALGTKIMVDLTKDYINTGDMIFVIPETSTQSMSLYFNASNTLKAIEDNPSIYHKLDSDNKKEIIGEYYNFVKERSKYTEEIVPSGVYKRTNFNENGDISYLETDKFGVLLRSQNRMGEIHYDPSTLVDHNFEISDEFAQYLNKYNSYAKNKGANVYYSFSPVNELSLIQSNDDLENSIIKLYSSLKNKLELLIVGNPREYIIDPHYFFDSNFHLNDNGAKLRTQIFAKNIYRDVLNKPVSFEVELIDKPEYPKIDINGEDSVSAKYFDFLDNGTSYSILSIKNDYKELKEIVLPTVYNQKPVLGIEKEAFKGSLLEKIIIPSIGLNNYFKNGCFDGCDNLVSIYLEEVNPDLINVSYTGELFSDSAAAQITIFVPSESITLYSTNYFWGAYSKMLEGYKND